MDERNSANEFVELTADIVAAYVENNQVVIKELPDLIATVYASLAGLIVSSAPAIATTERKAPAVSIKKSMGYDYLICLEDGQKFKSLKRHLRTTYNLSPHDYRAKWNLPSDYPMVAPEYAAKRSALAKTMGLGQKRRKAPPGKRKVGA